MSVPTLLAEQYQFQDTGVLLNGTSAVPFVDLTAVSGLDSAPVREAVQSREGQHGGWVDATYQDPRTVTLEGTVYASPTALDTYLDSLKANFAPTATDQPLYIGTDITSVRMVNGRSLGFSYKKDSKRRVGSADFQVQIVCRDPRIYATTVTSLAANGTLTLGGNRDTVGTITLAGPLTNPTVTLNGTTFTFAATSLTAGHSIVIDLDYKTVIQDGTTNVRSAMTMNAAWPVLNAGANTYSFTTGGGAGTVTVAARSAWQ